MPRFMRLMFCEGHAVTLALVGLLLCACSGSKNNSTTTATSQAAATCADPILITGAASLTGQTTNQAADSVSGDDGSCLGFATHGGERVYKVTLPAKNTNKLHLVVTPNDKPSAGAFDPVIYVTDTCVAQPKCSAAQDMRGGGGPEVLDFTNTSGQDQALYVVVDGYDYQPDGGGFTLDATFQTP